MLLNKKNDLTEKKIGIIGVGIMGEGMVYKLIEANYKLFIKKIKIPILLIKLIKKVHSNLKQLKRL